MDLSRLFTGFFNSEKAGGLLLILATIISLILANTGAGESYIGFWESHIGTMHVSHWINDALMAFFFLLIGLELEREVYAGELSDIRNATLPVFGAIGGMLLPAAIFGLFNFSSGSLSGAGIPMATDIAFAIGILSLLGKRVPASLKVFLTALAIIDDIGAILVIAVFYTGSPEWFYLMMALVIFGALLVLNRSGVLNLIPYFAGGVLMWYCMLHSGIHPTLSGILVAFAIPFGDGSEKSPSYILQHILHKPVAFVIVPLFALANTCIVFKEEFAGEFMSSNSIGIIMGFIIGKPLGIWLFSFIGVSIGACILPADLRWKHIAGAGMLGGIGFTMSIFIALLAYNNHDLIESSKIAILAASLFAGIVGFIWLRATLKPLPVNG